MADTVTGRNRKQYYETNYLLNVLSESSGVSNQTIYRHARQLMKFLKNEIRYT